MWFGFCPSQTRNGRSLFKTCRATLLKNTFTMRYSSVMAITLRNTFQTFPVESHSMVVRCTAEIIEAPSRLRVIRRTIVICIGLMTLIVLIASDEEVLIIGAGPTGKDLVHEVATVAKRVTFSTHRDVSKHAFTSNITVKTDIASLNETGANFVDGSHQTFTTILYCTGSISSISLISMILTIHSSRISILLSVSQSRMWSSHWRWLLRATPIQALHQHRISHNGHNRPSNLCLHVDVRPAGLSRQFCLWLFSTAMAHLLYQTFRFASS